MAVNLDAIRKKLQEFDFSTKNANKLQKWKKCQTVGEYKIRCVPWKSTEDGTPFKDLWIYYVGGESIVAPKQFGKPDPIYDLQKKLYSSGKDEDKQIAKQLNPKLRSHAAIIDRDAPQLGVQIWTFSKTIMQRMLGFYLDEEIQADIMDPKSGLDLKVKATQAKGKSALDLSVDVARSSSPLSKDVDEMNKWLQSVPDDIMPLYRFNTKTESEIEDILNKWLEAGSPSSFASDGSYTDKSSEKKLDLVDKLESELKQDKKKKSPVVDLDAAPKKTMSLDAAFEDLEKD